LEDYWLGRVRQKYTKVEDPEGACIHGDELDQDDEYIVVEWLAHDRWIEETNARVFKKEKDVGLQCIWEQGAIVPVVKKLGKMPDDATSFTLTQVHHANIMARLQPIR
jgi:hypothetical protein